MLRQPSSLYGRRSQPSHNRETPAVIYCARPRPIYEERRAVFSPTGRPEPIDDGTATGPGLKRRGFLHHVVAATCASAPWALAAGSLDDQLLIDGFGPEFAWGVSTSSFQIEGATTTYGRGPSIWDTFCHQPGRIREGHTAAVAADHYHRYSEDARLIAGAGFGNYRFSLSWSRILPAGQGVPNGAGLDFYDRLIDVLCEHGIEPWACLYHWDLPQALQDKGGWLNRESAKWFAEYAQIAARRLADRVTHWAMFNESAVHALMGYGYGEHAPGLKGERSFAAAMHHQNLAQGLALQTMRSLRRECQLGTVACIEPVQAAGENDRDRAAASYFSQLWNGTTIDPLLNGAYPSALNDLFGTWIKSDDMATIRQVVDFLGINYYNKLYIRYEEGRPFDAFFGPPPASSELTAMGWAIEPDGLYKQLITLRDNYGNPAVYIAENGAAYDDVVGPDGTVHDQRRIDYVRAHLMAARQAKREGANLQGYFVWSLLDSFEWTEGLGKRFGIVHVDFKTLKRTPKDSWSWFSRHLRR